MKIIGIITHKSVSKKGHNINYVYKNIVKKVYQNKAIPIGIILDEDYKEVIDICDGIIFQGGDDFEKYDKKAMEYCYINNVPTLGICLGMQLMGTIFKGSMKKIENHMNTYHDAFINKNSRLYKIYKKDKIKVNSRHNFIIEKPNLFISSISKEGYIESVEDSSKTFFIGVQWHPEDMNDNKLFKELIN